MTSLPCRSKVQEFRALRGLAALLALLASCHSSWVALLLDSKEVVQGSTGSGTVLFLYLIFHKSVSAPHQVWSWDIDCHVLLELEAWHSSPHIALAVALWLLISTKSNRVIRGLFGNWFQWGCRYDFQFWEQLLRIIDIPWPSLAVSLTRPKNRHLKIATSIYNELTPVSVGCQFLNPC